MVGKEQALALLERALKLSPADQTEVRLNTLERDLSRYANNAIHQNVSESSVRLTVKLAFGQQVGQVATSDLSEDGVQRLVADAARIAHLVKPNPQFVSFAKPQPLPDGVPTYFDATADCTPEDRARAIATILTEADGAGLEAAGICETMVQELAVANSHGVRAYVPSTDSGITTVLMADTGASYAADASRDFSALEPGRVAEEAVARAIAARHPRSVEAGEYEVILDHYAVADLLGNLSYMAFGAMGYQEGYSFMAGKLGQQVMGEKLSIWDDGLDPRGAAMPCDSEGVPKRCVELITNGVATGVVYDTFTANREPGKASTGHAAHGPYSNGAENLIIGAGDSDRAAMIRATKRGILVTRFHYIRSVHAGKTIVTGMTRDGAFLVENGQLIGPVKNLRFTQSIAGAFANVDLVGAEQRRVGNMVVPMLKLGKFNFTGGTDH